MKKVIFLLFAFIISVSGQQWRGYYNRIPAWPSTITFGTIDTYMTKLEDLKAEVQDATPHYMKDMENMSKEDAMKLAMEFQKNAMNMSPQEIERRSKLANNYSEVEYPKEIELQTRLGKVMKEFNDKIFDEINSIKEKYPCDIGIESSSDKCDERSAALKNLGAKLGNEYFLGAKAKIRGAVDAIIDYMIKEKLPLSAQREKDQMKTMGVNVSGDMSGMEIVGACIDQLKSAAEKMRWIAGINQDENWHYYPGQDY